MATAVVRNSGVGGGPHNTHKSGSSSSSVSSPSRGAIAQPLPVIGNLKSAGGGGSGHSSSTPATPTTPTLVLGGMQRSGRSSSDKCRTPKKLCFREPEVISHSTSSLHKIGTIAESSTSIDSKGLAKANSVKVAKSAVRGSGATPEHDDDLEVKMCWIIYW